MKKTQLISTTVLVALGIVTVSQPVSAAGNIVSTADNKADIQFRQKDTTDENNNDIIEPENPGRDETIYLPSTSTEDKRPTNRGPLVIDYISDYHFNIEKMSGNNAVYYAKPAVVYGSQADVADPNDLKNPITVPNYVQVTDDRGTNAGWSLKVQQTADFTVNGQPVADGVDDGSALRKTTLKINNINAFKRNNNAGVLPSGVKEGSSIELSKTGPEAPIMIAKEGEGTGSIAVLAGNVKTANPTADKSIELFVPGEIKKQRNVTYQATLTWNLEDAPDKTSNP